MNCIGQLFGQVATNNSPQYHSVIPRNNLTSAQKNDIFKSLAKYESQYNANESMIKQSYTWTYGTYHTVYKGNTVHRTRNAAEYAVNLFDSGNATMEKRGFDVLRKVLSLQDTNSSSRTYGIWSYFLEEPLHEMMPPDWNWADFIGTQLLQISINHHDRLPKDLAEKLDWGIIHAARSIQKRNVGPDYTNIAIMGTYVTLTTSEIYGLTDLHDYAMKRLRIFSNFTKNNGRAFAEYNSPTYTMVAIDELGRLRMHAIGDEAKQLVNELYHIGWEEIAEHYHRPTGQWSGPHSRSYGSLLGGDVTGFLSNSLNETWDPRRPLPIPDDLTSYFTSDLDKPRTVLKTYSKDPLNLVSDLIGTTYLHPLFSIGSARWGEMWNQRRPLIAYWGTKQKPSYLQLRFLHDNYDFSNVVFYSVQKEDRVLAGLVFATDGGDTHLSLDRIRNATIKAKDLRIRFEIGGSDVDSAWQAAQRLLEPTKFTFENISIQFALPSVQFSCSNQLGWSISRANNRLNIDYVLYTSTVEQTIKLDALAEAVGIVAVKLSSTKNDILVQPITISQNSMLYAKWDDLCLTIPFKPMNVSTLRKLPKFSC
ncbi:unnamed protein product [Adineta ricciae]|uniref:Uncharacterized protein n=1 Tax=Adineta ricciae TaxID=249248 RepID=A0A814D088_ADIRI|nr:unnamed protein product [Adineta ricciae]